MKTNNTKRVKESVMAVIDESPVRNKHKLNQTPDTKLKKKIEDNLNQTPDTKLKKKLEVSKNRK